VRVLYLHQHFSTPDGALATRSYEMSKCLLERGHQVLMICGSYDIGKTGLSGPFKNGRRVGIVDGIEILEFDLPYSNRDNFLKRGVTFLKFILRSLVVSLTGKYDLVFATSTPLTAGIPAILARTIRRKPFVFEVRDLWPELPREMGVITNPIILAGMSILEWISYRAANGCIGLSPGIVRGIRRRSRKNLKVEMISNGCDLALFNDNEKGQRINMGDQNDLLAVFTGAHGIANGLHAVLDAAKELKCRNRKDIKMVFIGDGRYKPKLMQRAAEEGLDNCIFLNPMIKRELGVFLKKVDVGLMILANVKAFYYGTSPNKFFDYIACGLPVLNNYPGWLADLITANHCGVVIPPANPSAFADTLEDFADHRQELETMGSNSRRLAEQEFDRKKLAGKFVDFLETVYKDVSKY